MGDEMRERVARALADFEVTQVRTCALYDPGEQCGYCTRRAEAVLAAIDLKAAVHAELERMLGPLVRWLEGRLSRKEST